ncbi:SDR family oxidoreductase [Paracrocinitomix mangrovi]|uniref:SDR family NAD(P)-dependent oxidoreductase n=1 Tax=Paracrocinitomix mangrovi TaxID=2862509 RepID=UPI001C8E76A8|nr:SDR family oxidoreductase [Paracrocinitomix mangrovi]UKN01926.1 SDR family oxidoreductase [Paracrocinitomix mangrovi]
MSKNIIVIGASRGIGRELAKKLAEDHNVLVMSRNLDKLKELQMTTLNPVKIASLDLAADNVREYISTIINEHFQHVDILINNAGYLVNKPFLETTAKDIKDVYATNVFGLVAACQAVVPFMKNGGHIVNIGSVGGVQGSAKFPGIGIYSSSKAAVAGFTECLAEELKDENIQVNCLALGAVQTEMLEEAFPGYEAPMGPIDMAEYIADFSLKANKWMNGKIISVSKSTP